MAVRGNEGGISIRNFSDLIIYVQSIPRRWLGNVTIVYRIVEENLPAVLIKILSIEYENAFFFLCLIRGFGFNFLSANFHVERCWLCITPEGQKIRAIFFYRSFSEISPTTCPPRLRKKDPSLND